MSGGKFNYDQYRIRQIADEVENKIRNNGKKDDWGNIQYYPQPVIDLFHDGIRALRIAEIYAQRIDWLLSCDDSEETFIERLKEDLEEYEKGESK